MKTMITLALLCIATLGNSQSAYEKGMGKAFELWNENKLDEAANLFERIAAAEEEQWLPDYYTAQIYVLKCWNTWEDQTEATLKPNLDKAQEHINNMLTIDKDNPYAKQMQAQLYTVWVAYDGAKYGMKYSGKVSELYAKAQAAERENPIFILNKAEWDMGAARYFGSDTTPYCKEIKRAIDLFATFKPETEFHPSYGLDRAQEAYAECNK
ncbi:hypothetical protein [uncultured Dokdonia sp.]|uniref:hypothetical protein n=1 Tax=uncultured Dokdonia sp. TaxID=575653 RepID=UPI0026322B49|nr:hypothetical protein [uncultured Dokdonia sp.]